MNDKQHTSTEFVPCTHLDLITNASLQGEAAPGGEKNIVMVIGGDANRMHVHLGMVFTSARDLDDFIGTLLAAKARTWGAG